jgi:hypothetical protein
MRWDTWVRGNTSGGFLGPVTSHYVPGEWNAVCDLTNQVAKSGDMVRQWNGLYVRREVAEEQHPQENLPPAKDDSRIPWARPRRDTFRS